MRSEPVFIGPCCVGKSTIAGLTAESLRVLCMSMDEVRLKYYLEMGYDAGHADALEREHGFRA